MSFQSISLFISFYLFICSSISFNINLITPDNNVINMYSSGTYNSSFVEQSATFNCSMNHIYTYSQSSSQYQANTPYTIQFSNLNTSLSFTLKSIYLNKFTPTLSSSSCFDNVTTCNIIVQNNCPSDIGQFNYFTIL